MSNIYVCRCKKITEFHIVEAIKGGAKTFEDVQEVTKLGTGCTLCKSKAQELFDLLLKENK